MVSLSSEVPPHKSRLKMRGSFLFLLHGIHPFQVSFAIYSGAWCRVRDTTLPDRILRRHLALDLLQKQLETKTEDICVVRWSKSSGYYLMNFNRPKEVSCKKTESREHTRCPQGRGARPGGRAHPPPSWTPPVLPRLLLIFLFS